MKTPYEIYKSLCLGEVPPEISFSVWFDEVKTRYVETHPESRQWMKNSTFRNRGELERFFVWLNLEYPSGK